MVFITLQPLGYNTQQNNQYISGVPSTPTVKLSVDFTTLYCITYSSYIILQHRRLQPDNGSVHLNVRQIISQKEIKFPTIHAIWLVELLHLFLQKANFPYRITISSTIAYD